MMRSVGTLTRADLAETLVRLAAGGRGLLVTSHDDEFVARLGARVLRLADGGLTPQSAV